MRGPRSNLASPSTIVRGTAATAVTEADTGGLQDEAKAALSGVLKEDLGHQDLNRANQCTEDGLLVE